MIIFYGRLPVFLFWRKMILDREGLVSVKLPMSAFRHSGVVSVLFLNSKELCYAGKVVTKVSIGVIVVLFFFLKINMNKTAGFLPESR